MIAKLNPIREVPMKLNQLKAEIKRLETQLQHARNEREGVSFACKMYEQDLDSNDAFVRQTGAAEFFKKKTELAKHDNGIQMLQDKLEAKKNEKKIINESYYQKVRLFHLASQKNQGSSPLAKLPRDLVKEVFKYVDQAEDYELTVKNKI